jgi:phage terminase small subunit
MCGCMSYACGDASNWSPSVPKVLIQDQVFERKPLTEMEREFCFYFVRSATARDAAMLAGYKSTNLRSLDVTISRLQKRPNVIAEINRLRAERAEKLDISLDDILLRISALATKAQAKGDLNTALKALIELKSHLTEVSLRKTNKEEVEAAPAQDDKRVHEEAADHVLELRRSHERAREKWMDA